jgi:hypothetical protein
VSLQRRLERAVNGRGPEAAASGAGSSSSSSGPGAGGGSSSSSSGQKGEVLDAALTSAIADLHKFSMMQSMYKSAVHLLEDLQNHLKMLHTPERAQVLLAAAQNPLLGEHHFAKALLPRLCTIILSAPRTTRHVSTGFAAVTQRRVCMSDAIQKSMGPPWQSCSHQWLPEWRHPGMPVARDCMSADLLSRRP